jgi:hypothetical protein
MFTLVCPECDDFAIDVVVPKGFDATLAFGQGDDGTASYHQNYEAIPDHKVTVFRHEE